MPGFASVGPHVGPQASVSPPFPKAPARSVRRVSVGGVITVIVTGKLCALWVGIKIALGKPSPRHHQNAPDTKAGSGEAASASKAGTSLAGRAVASNLGM
jgi:hypothetical protein